MVSRRRWYSFRSAKTSFLMVLSSKVSFHLLPEQDADEFGIPAACPGVISCCLTTTTAGGHSLTSSLNSQLSSSGELVSPLVSNVLAGEGGNLQVFRLVAWFQIQSLDAVRVRPEDLHMLLPESSWTPQHQICLAAREDSRVDFWNCLTNK